MTPDVYQLQYKHQEGSVVDFPHLVQAGVDFSAND
jgi:hypothetical protein